MVLETISEMWSNLITGTWSFPDDRVAAYIYVIGIMVALWAWYGIVKRFPQPLGGILWIIVFACLATPTVSEGNNASIAPAIFAVLFGVLTKEYDLVWANAASILLVIGLSFLVGFFWSKYQQQKHSV